MKNAEEERRPVCKPTGNAMMKNALLTAALILTTAAVGRAQSDVPGARPSSGIPSSQMPSVLSKVTFEQRLNERLPLDLQFKDEEGRTVKLGDYFGKRPVLMAFVYYDCPMLCTQVLNGIDTSLTVLNETVGREFDVVAVSFDPRETPALANGKKKAQVDRYKRPGSEAGWHFLTGEEPAIRELTDAAGFHFVWDDKTQQFAHPSGIVVVTPDGRLARYFFGIEYASRDVKFALIESSAGRIGNAIDQLLLYCYHYNPATGQYGFVTMSLVRIAGVLTLAALAGFVIVSVRRDARAASKA